MLQKKVLFILILITAGHSLLAQNKKLHLQCDKGSDKQYKMHEASTTHCFADNKPYEVAISLLDEMIYRITLCTEDEHSQAQIPFSIYTEKNIMQFDTLQQRLVERKKTIKVFDNEDNALKPVIEFQSADNKNGTIKIYPPLVYENTCVGILIQYKEDDE